MLLNELAAMQNHLMLITQMLLLLLPLLLPCHALASH
jgi:hypothetical protein